MQFETYNEEVGVWMNTKIDKKIEDKIFYYTGN